MQVQVRARLRDCSLLLQRVSFLFVFRWSETSKALSCQKYVLCGDIQIHAWSHGLN